MTKKKMPKPVPSNSDTLQTTGVFSVHLNNEIVSVQATSHQEAVEKAKGLSNE